MQSTAGLRLFAGALALVATWAMSAGADAQTTYKMNISVPQNSHYGVAVDKFAEVVAAKSNGKYKIQNFYASALGNEREAMEAVQLGTLDLVMTSTGPVPNFVPGYRSANARQFTAGSQAGGSPGPAGTRGSGPSIMCLAATIGRASMMGADFRSPHRPALGPPTAYL